MLALLRNFGSISAIKNFHKNVGNLGVQVVDKHLVDKGDDREVGNSVGFRTFKERTAFSKISTSISRARHLHSDALVRTKNMLFQKTFNPKKSFLLFSLFTFELREFNFHFLSKHFDGAPVIHPLSSQIRFAEIGDVMQLKIDLNGLWFVPIKISRVLCRRGAKGLEFELQLSGLIKISSTVLAYLSTRTIESKLFAPVGYHASVFLSEGDVNLSGWASMRASLNLLEIEKNNAPGEQKKAFFVYLQKNKVPTNFWNFHMREMGFGFGYTLAGAFASDKAKTPTQLIRVLDDVSKRQDNLTLCFSWNPDSEDNRFTLPLEDAIQAYHVEQICNEETKEVIENPFFFDVVIAMQSNLIVLASMRRWLDVLYVDSSASNDEWPMNPNLRSYCYVSVLHSELHAWILDDSLCYVTERHSGWQTSQNLRKAMQSVAFSSTLYIRPGLFHYELGWPQ